MRFHLLVVAVAVLCCSLAEGGGAAKTGKPRSSAPADPDPEPRSRKRLSAHSIATSEAILKKPAAPNALRSEPLLPSLDAAQLSEVVMNPKRAASLGLEEDSVVLVRGKRRKYSCALLRLDKSVAEDALRTSPQVLRNLRCRPSDLVTVTAPHAPLPTAASIELAPCSEDLAGSGLSEAELISAYIQPHLAASPYCHLDDAFSVTVAGKTIEFRVTAVDSGSGSKAKAKAGDAAAGACLVGPDTRLTCDPADALSRAQDPSRNLASYDDLGGCRQQLAAIRELVELPLRHPSLFTKVGVGLGAGMSPVSIYSSFSPLLPFTAPLLLTKLLSSTPRRSACRPHEASCCTARAARARCDPPLPLSSSLLPSLLFGSHARATWR